MATLDVNDYHQATIVNYLRFARYQRSQRLRALDMCFDDVKNSRLTDDTFTVDEVKDILQGLLDLVNSETESELINTTHTNVLLLRQIFQQAEKWHLKLAADISQLENSELLEKIADFEEKELAGQKNMDWRTMPKLEPMNESGGTALLQMEIGRLGDENGMLKDRLRRIECQATEITSQKGDLQKQLFDAQKELDSSTMAQSHATHDEVEELRKKVALLQTSMNESGAACEQNAAGMQQDLAAAKKELLDVQNTLEMAEKELEKKVSITAPYQNLKKMLQKKNDQMKDLRKKLSKYEDISE